MGRPRKEIDWTQLDSLVMLNASLTFCAERQLLKWGEQPNFKTIKAAMEIIERRIEENYRITFTEYKEQRKDPVRMKLLQKQIDIALNGNVTMLIWLGKQMMGQSDKIDQNLRGQIDSNVQVILTLPANGSEKK